MPSHSRPRSPDGRRIAFYRHTTRARSAVYVMNVDGSGEQPLTRALTTRILPGLTPENGNQSCGASSLQGTKQTRPGNRPSASLNE